MMIFFATCALIGAVATVATAAFLSSSKKEGKSRREAQQSFAIFVIMTMIGVGGLIIALV